MADEELDEVDLVNMVNKINDHDISVFMKRSLNQLAFTAKVIRIRLELEQKLNNHFLQNDQVSLI